MPLLIATGRGGNTTASSTSKQSQQQQSQQQKHMVLCCLAKQELEERRGRRSLVTEMRQLPVLFLFFYIVSVRPRYSGGFARAAAFFLGAPPVRRGAFFCFLLFAFCWGGKVVCVYKVLYGGRYLSFGSKIFVFGFLDGSYKGVDNDVGLLLGDDVGWCNRDVVS